MDSAILCDLNEAQKAAVVSPAPVVQILAPPGSGKTKTLTARVAYLLEHHHYKPWNIICVTFTIKSAREMKERIAKLIGNGLESKLVLGTFHSVCRRYLVSYGSRIGIQRGFGIADSADSQSIINRITKRLKVNIDAKQARSRISSSKARGIGYEQLKLEAAKSKKSNVDQQEFITVYEEYERHLKISNLLDYDDLLLRCVDLLERHPNCVTNVEAVLVDEFQDTNQVQYRLMNLLAAKNQRITTVGDPDQSIYGWRSAEIQNLRKMQRLYPDTLVINLENNYRSAGAILKAAFEVIEQDESRPPKPLLATHCRGTTPTFRRLPSSAIEAVWIVTELRRSMALCGEGLLTYSDYAILLRSAALSRQIESALGKAGIPYRMVGGLRFFDRVEVKILLDYMRVVSQPDNSDAFARILNVPSRGVGDVTIKALLEEARARNMTLHNLIKGIIQTSIKATTKISKPAEQGLSSVFNIIATCRKKLHDEEEPLTPQQLLDTIWKRLQFKDYLGKKYPEDHENRWANVEELINQAADCTFMTDNSEGDAYADEDSLPQIAEVEQDTQNKAEEALTKFLANVALATEIQKEDEFDQETGAPIPRVTISTIHAAKGLEWPVVFIPAAYEGSIPHSRAEDHDEERRLLYVAMTRAKVLLYMSAPLRNTNGEETTLSPFLTKSKIASRLVDQGPCLRTDKIVPDIARILGRPCPSQDIINEGISKIECLEDDQWPLDGSVDAETIAERGLGRASAFQDDGSYAPKQWRAKRELMPVDDRLSGGFTYARSGYEASRTTMQNTKNFTMTHTTGFTSAASLPTQQPDNGDHTKTFKNDFKKATGKTKGPNSSQGTLTAMWQPKIQGANTQSSHTYSNLSHKSRMNSFSTSSVYTDEKRSLSFELDEEASLPPLKRAHIDATRRPMARIPPSMANHSLRPLSASNLRPKIEKEGQDDVGSSNRYVFLSSSPPRPERGVRDSASAAQTAQDDGQYRRQIRGTGVTRGHETGAGPDTTGAQPKSRPSHPAAVRSLNEFHNTSMAQIQARRNDMQARSGEGVQRRTLGVRRTMVGWSSGVTGGKFSAPSRKGGVVSRERGADGDSDAGYGLS